MGRLGREETWAVCPDFPAYSYYPRCFVFLNPSRCSYFLALLGVPWPECGSFSTVDLGCKAEQGDSLAAYTQALLWIATGDHAYAAKAIGIMNGWSAVPRQGHTNANGPVQAAWTGELWPRGAGPAIWGNKRYTPKLVAGLLQATARDSQHANLALASMVNAAETARQQGVDRYAEQGQRIMAALEYQAQFLPPNHGTPPAQLKFNLHPTWEIAYREV